MNISFEPLGMQHQTDVMAIFNHYILTSTAAFPGTPLPEPFFAMILKKSEGGYPTYAVLCDGKVAGFCQLSPYNPFSSFVSTACVTYFLAPEYTGKGVGAACLGRLKEDGKEMNISHLIAEVSSENEASLRFHEKNGFRKVGDLKEIGSKFGRSFGIILLQKDI